MTKVVSYDGGPTIQLPHVTEPSATPSPQPMPPTKAPSGDTVSNITNLLDQSVFGIPVKYLAIGAAIYFMMRK